MRDTAIAKMNLSGAMDLIKKSKKPLTPLYEAITNSLEAISQRNYPKTEQPKIEVSMKFSGLLDDVKKLDKIEISDNGEGFNSVNYGRFLEFFDKSKGYDNKGSGRLQFLHRFEDVYISSVYVEGGEKRHRTCTCSVSKFVSNENDAACDAGREILTKILLSNPVLTDDDSVFFDTLDIDDLLNSIRNHFMLRFYLDVQKANLNMPEISLVFEKNGEELAQRKFRSSDILEPESLGKISVPYLQVVDPSAEKIEWKPAKDRVEDILWAHFQVPEDDLKQNGVYLCSKDMPVQELRFSQIKKNESVDKFRYLTAFYGEVLDSPNNVNDSVDSFKFPDRKETEDSIDDMFFDANEEFLFFDTIKEQVDAAIPNIYQKIFEVKEKQSKDVEGLAKAHGIPLDVAASAKINLTDDEKTITKKIFAEQSKQLAEKGYKAKKIYESLSELNPTTDDYQEQLEQKTIELSALIMQQNKEELSRYILRREMVADILKKILDEELEYQVKPLEKGKNKDKEGLVHDLIFKRKSSNTAVLNDLWILNEEFLHFEGCSELPLNQLKDGAGNALLEDMDPNVVKELGIKTDRRPDIFLFAEEGKCVIIELKAPDVDLSDHLNQMTKYCNLIANHAVEKFDRFYCYLIGENVNPYDLPGDYEETVNGDWLKSDLPIRSLNQNRETIASSQIEVIRLSSIYARAHRRNKSFADKLGLPDLLSENSEQDA